MPDVSHDPAALGRDLLAWYDRHRRVLPWRALPGEAADPYRVWLSEIMLQQTTTAAAAPYFRRFVERWPTVRDLAGADLDDVLKEWAGLGYYARAHNLHRCAQVVARELGGRFPDDEEALRALPGVGAYTAAAVAAIAFGRPATVVDGNVERVMARLHRVEDPLPGAKDRLRALAAALTPAERPGDHAQAVMDLGATICTPRKPLCGLCPWMAACLARRSGRPEDYPRKAEKAEKPTRRGVAFWLVRPDGAVLLRRRPEKGLLGGMTEIPSTEWREAPWTAAEAQGQAPFGPNGGGAHGEIVWREVPGVVRHTFSHFHLELAVLAGRLHGLAAVRAAAGAGGLWVSLDALSDQALPSVMRKVAQHAIRGLAGRGKAL